ncbi:hypothetical protein WR25_12340 [Diploscapter pachys]|uniref:Ig-like domain-containing protein n=1 Tax=Diploscapter pachys TaxID=2018661 RepID=A0A2A2LB95_9BILA|nr:hypothetical protein WR25_12340 [Diploscapter pachys]
METKLVNVLFEDGILFISINRPEKRNCVNHLTALQLIKAFERLNDDEQVKIGIFYGEGNTFCAGYDLSEVSESKGKIDVIPHEFFQKYRYMGPSIMEIRKPLIVAIEGHAVAGGLEMSLLGDLRVAASDAILGVYCRRVGVPLLDGGTVRLPKVVGVGRALDMVLTGRGVPANEALQWGLVNRVVQPGKALEEATKLARLITSHPYSCMLADRDSLFKSLDLTTDEAFKYEFQSLRVLPEAIQLYLCLPILIRATTEEPEVKVVGTTSTVAIIDGHVSTPSKTLHAQINDLWCGAESLGQHIASEYGEFTRLRDGKVFTGTVTNGKVFMEIGKAPANLAGSYRCEIRTLDKKLYNGLLEVYVPPVLIFEKNAKVVEATNSTPPQIVGETIEVAEGDPLSLECPIFSHPKAAVIWQKDGKTVDPTDIITYQETTLFINGTSTFDSGSYRCIADNSFPLTVDGQAESFKLYYDLNVTVLATVADEQLRNKTGSSNLITILKFSLCRRDATRRANSAISRIETGSKLPPDIFRIRLRRFSV